jgi:dTDP-4-amino-4,6-dideoxygalactose transaminase
MRSDENVADALAFDPLAGTSENETCHAEINIGDSHLDPTALGQVMKQYDLKDPWDVVALFENQVAEYAGSKYAVALDTCTFAIFLALKYLKATGTVTIPASTYISVPASILHAGLKVEFDSNLEWSGTYRLDPYPIVDGAVRFTSGMYEKGTLHCLSFHRRKHLQIGRGGMILTDDPDAARWLRLARYNGRRTDVKYQEQEDFELVGWNSYMTPEAAARGVYLMAKLPKYNADKNGSDGYSDLSNVLALQPRGPAAGPQRDI